MHKILVFIPTYRCEKQISRVISQFDLEAIKWVDTVILVDNQSIDKTIECGVEFGKKKLANCNFIALRNDANYGLGGSHKIAFQYALENDFDYLVVLHGDDQSDIKDLIPQLKAGNHLTSDCLLGARFMSGSSLKGYSGLRTFGNHVFNQLFSLVTRQSIFDLGSGLNLYRLEAFKDFYYKTFPDDLTFNYVMLLASFHRNQTVRFFPISWREEDQESNVKLFSQAFKVLTLLVRYAIHKNSFLKSDLRLKMIDAYTCKTLYNNKPSE